MNQDLLEKAQQFLRVNGVWDMDYSDGRKLSQRLAEFLEEGIAYENYRRSLPPRRNGPIRGIGVPCQDHIGSSPINQETKRERKRCSRVFHNFGVYGFGVEATRRADGLLECLLKHTTTAVGRAEYVTVALSVGDILYAERLVRIPGLTIFALPDPRASVVSLTFAIPDLVWPKGFSTDPIFVPPPEGDDCVLCKEPAND